MGIFKNTIQSCKTGEIITIRTAVQSDAESLNLLAMEIFKTSDYLITTPEEFTSFTDEQQKDRIKKYEENENNLLLIAEYNNELLGTIDFSSVKRKRIAHKGSFGMSVRSSWRGRGIGELLLSNLIEWVRVHPVIEIINLGVIEENKPAVALYSKLGFEIIGREPFGVKLNDGTLIADLSMSLRVSK